MPSAAERARRARARRSTRMQTSAPRRSALARRHDRAAELVDARDQALVERVHVLARLGDADLLHQLDPGDAGVDRRDRRRARLEAARGRRRRVAAVVHLEDVLVGEPAGLRSAVSSLGETRPRPQEAEPGRAEQVLEDAGREHVDAELAHVERVRADRLVGVEHDERAVLVRDRRDLLDRQPRAVAVADRGDRDDRGALVDRLVERSTGSPGRRPTCTTSAPRSSCACQICPIVGNSKSLITTFGALARSRSRDASALTPAESDVVTATSSGCAADEARERAARRLGALDPVVPRRAALVPARRGSRRTRRAPRRRARPASTS